MKQLLLSALIFCSINMKAQKPLCDTTGHMFPMAVKFGQVSARMSNGHLKVDFKMEDQTDVVKYVVMVSYDGKTFEPLGEPILPEANRFVYTADYGFK